MIIYNFEKHDWDEVQSTITDVKHLEAYKSILVEFKSLYAITRKGNCDDQRYMTGSMSCKCSLIVIEKHIKPIKGF